MQSKRTSGILLHPTSLPSAYGIGDFGSNGYEFVDKLKKANQTLWQILPLCPVDDTNSPYQSPSAFAGEPLLIDLVGLKNLGLLTEEEINNNVVDFQGKTDFDLARKIKYPLFETAYERLKNSSSNIKSDFKKFKEREGYWLDAYTLFMSLKEELISIRSNKKDPKIQKELATFIKESKEILPKSALEQYFYGAVWCSFPKDVRAVKDEAIVSWSNQLSDRIEYFAFLQYIFYSQWQKLKCYANDNGIKIIGDIPIFVSYDSADVWQNQKDFLLDKKGFPTNIAGVPPDYFSKDGQLWGNPLYNFKNQKKANYEWWYLRFKKALEVADTVRIDHFRGFESYWKVPFGSKTAIKGAWEKSAGIKLFETISKRLDIKELPVIAEDLGVITDEVVALRNATGFPGMAILHFAFGDNLNHNYLPHMLNKNTVLYTGTHDNNTTLGWYKNASEVEKDHFRRYMNSSGENPSWDLIRLAYSSCADCVIIPLQDVLNLDSNYAMNTPGTVGGNWGFAFNWDMWQESDTQGLDYLSKLFSRNVVREEKTAKKK